MKAKFTLKCMVCGKEYPNDCVGTCTCGGMLDAFYGLDKIQSFVDPLKKGLWRYWRLLPVDPPSSSLFQSNQTPLRKSRKLGDTLGVRNLWIKDESKNPTRTFKYREAILTILRFHALGIREFVACSTGNTAAAFSFVASNLGTIRVNLLIPRARMIDFQIPTTVKAAYIDADYYEVCDLGPKFAIGNHMLWEGGFANFCRREGLKTIAFEVAERKLEPDWYVQAVGSGVGPCGVFKGYSELQELGVVEKAPRVLCIQPETCSPMVRAFKAGREEFPTEFTVKHPTSCAKSLIQGRPSSTYPYVRRVVLTTEGNMESASEGEIRKAQKLMQRYEGLSCEFSSATALAGLIKCLDEGTIDKSDVILLNHSGGVRKETNAELPIFPIEAPVAEIYRSMECSTLAKPC